MRNAQKQREAKRAATRKHNIDIGARQSLAALDARIAAMTTAEQLLWHCPVCGDYFTEDQARKDGPGEWTGGVEILLCAACPASELFPVPALPCALCGELAPPEAAECPECGGNPAAQTADCPDCDGEGGHYERFGPSESWIECKGCSDQPNPGGVPAPYLFERALAAGEPWAVEQERAGLAAAAVRAGGVE